MVAVLALACGPAAAATLEGARFDDTVRLAGSDLRLNGLGLRAVSILKGYVAGLYLTQKAGTGEEAMAAPGPKRVQMRLLIDAPPQVFNKALVSGIRKNASEAELAALRERIDLFESMIDAAGTLRQGDTVDLDYEPARGMTLAVNGKAQPAVVPGADFYNAVLGIFVGPRPVDAKLKSGLLGQ
ncbi:hypothetical protein RD110_10530 [Rhodoferax koreense]|uniref:Chalcone isomerase domain-containing protein n=2 Tax=Rhodoferax koreensis TaxID=1842727 RepID=A0A1P8K3N7_9BURK|nr:hypothetical protein RD110_10530 [Rhodoferax koreense]